MERKEILLGTRPEGSSRDQVRVDVRLTDDGELGIMGESFYAGLHEPPLNGRYIGGQCDELLAEIDQPADGWTIRDIRQLADIWQRWHLNRMRAGCEHQRAMGWTPSYGPDGKPDADDPVGKPCPVCGYKYGTAWLSEDLPAFVAGWIGHVIREGTPPR